MESIERNVGDIAANERQVYETVLGHKLAENQRVIIKVMDIDASETNCGHQSLPALDVDHWAIFRDLPDQEVAELESAILQRSSGRDIDI